MIGRLHTWLDHKGYGFIRPDDGSNDVFVHVNNLPDKEVPPIGTKVEFEVVKGKHAGSLQADNVQVRIP